MKTRITALNRAQTSAYRPVKVNQNLISSQLAHYTDPSY